MLNWLREYHGLAIRDIQDVPEPIKLRWFELVEALRQIDLVEQSLYLAQHTEKSHAKYQQVRQEMLRRSGFIKALDHGFHLYWQSYLKRRSELAGDDELLIELPGGGELIVKQARLTELKRMLKACLRRLRGLRSE